MFSEERFVTESGDSIVGEVVSKADGFIVIRSKIFGELRVAEDKISIVPLETVDVKDVSAPHSPLTLNPPSSATDTSSVDAAAQADPAKKKTRELFKLPNGMKLKAGLGIGFLSGETAGRNYSTSLQVDYDSGRYVNSFSGEYMYGKVQGQRVTDLYKADNRTDRYFGDVKNRKYFSMYEGKLSSDRIHLIDEQVELLVGLGMDVHKGEVAEIQFTAGYSSEWEDFLGDPTTGVIDPTIVHRNKAFLHQEVNLKLNDKFTLKEDGYYMIEAGDWGNHELRIDTTISYLLSSHLSLDLVYSLEFDNTSAFGIEDDVSRLTLQFGYQL